MSYGSIPDELLGDVPYFLGAYFFGWTKEEMDRQDSDYVEKMLILVRGLLESSKDSSSMNGLRAMMKGKPMSGSGR